MERIPIDQTRSPIQALLICVGGFGCGVLNEPQLRRYPQASLLAIDRQIGSSRLHDPIQRLDLSEFEVQLRYDMISAAKDARRILPEIEQASREKNLVILFAGFGGGVGSGVLPVIADKLQHLGKMIISYIVMPNERISGRKQLLTAQIALNELHPVSSCLFVGSQPSDGEASLNYCRIGRNLETILDITCAPGVIPVHCSALLNAIVSRSIRAISTARSEGPDKAKTVANEIISDPCISQYLDAPSALILHMKTKEPTLHELNEIATSITSRWQAECDLIYGVSADLEIGEGLQAGLIVSKL